MNINNAMVKMVNVMCILPHFFFFLKGPENESLHHWHRAEAPNFQLTQLNKSWLSPE